MHALLIHVVPDLQATGLSSNAATTRRARGEKIKPLKQVNRLGGDGTLNLC